jgi:antitoxin (DNA-binding transcriptional repressor) of toxin-antitoxin stability system
MRALTLDYSQRKLVERTVLEPVTTSADDSCDKKAMIEEMATVRITEAELARDIHAVLAKVREGVEVIVVQDHRPVAVIKTPQGPDRKISECIALAKAYEEKLGYTPVPDPDFAKDVQAAIDAHREPLNPPAWD